MVKMTLDHFDASKICRSGQCFRMMESQEGHFTLIAGDRYLKLEQNGAECTFYCSEEEFEDFWKNYFDVDTEYNLYDKMIDPDDVYLTEAAEFGRGIRILRQDLWEMIVSFLISQQNNIVRIRRCIENICRAYGEERMQSGESYYAFPTPDSLAGLKEDDLMACNLGYRSKYVVRAARNVVDGDLDLYALKTMSYQDARGELLKMYGVGNKVADCICLFSLHHLSAFPVDTHINQAMRKHYPTGFPFEYYRDCQGLMQQYIFYYELEGMKRK